MATAQETAPMEAPLYYVELPPTMPDLVFPADEYELAYQHATGETSESGGDDLEDENRISVIDFDGEIEVPIADV